MTTADINSIGLIFDIIGAVLLFAFGLPSKIQRDGAQYLMLEQADESEARKAGLHDRLSKLGLGLLILGFVLQLVSNYY